MISVRSLSKRFGAQTAVDALSFDVPAGQIVGFLGPNGAGKSTTLRMLTGMIAPSAGTATVCGFDLIRGEGLLVVVLYPVLRLSVARSRWAPID
jgi:ABC-2 type transport system ATP-binding protein